MNNEYRILTGNDACVLGAIAAGMRFFAGYPITPATEIAESASVLLPKVGGKYIQMEDEIASIAAVIGASFAGVKAMTATSGPGISLMQENLGYGMIAEVPCVVVDVMRQGPCQGVATQPAQGDIMQSKWGTHGDHPVIVLAPSSVSEVYYETVRAFNLAERFRTPVMLLSDATLAHMSEKVKIPDASELEIINRQKPTGPKDRSFKPYGNRNEYGVSPMGTFGDGYRWYVSGMIHDEGGFPIANNPKTTEDLIGHILSKIADHTDAIESYEEYLTEDAEVILLSIGLTARSAKKAVDILRAQGKKVGLFRPITLWPFPEKRFTELAAGARKILSCEMNEGQLCLIAKQMAGATPVGAITQNNGKMIEADTIVKAVMEEY